jgi:hypothetical protein
MRNEASQNEKLQKLLDDVPDERFVKKAGIDARRRIGFSIWIGEFGWEIMTWQSYLRKLSHDYDRMIISTFPGMEPLYSGFHCEVDFLPHQHPGRALDWRDTSMVETGFDATQYTAPVDIIKPIKQFQTDGEYIRYGTPHPSDIEVLFHARGIEKANFKNWPEVKWHELAANFPKAASVGTLEDYHIPGTVDRRGVPLQELMDLMASSQVIVGQSSGVMHLASLCGLRQVVWGDNKTYFGQTLEQRYRGTWNPLDTPVTWVETDAWDPETNEVFKGIINEGTGRPSQKALSVLKAATGAGKYLLAVAYIEEKDGQAQIESYCETVEYPNDKLSETAKQIQKNLNELCQKAGVAVGGEGDNIWR